MASFYSGNRKPKSISTSIYLFMMNWDGHATSDHAWTIYHQFGSTNLEDESAPPPNAPVDCEPMDTSNQRHEALRSSVSKIIVRASRTPRTNGEIVASENIGDKLGELAASIKESKTKTWKENSPMHCGTWSVIMMMTWKWSLRS